MKVKELIEDLQKEDPEREVVISRDAEGNGHSPIHGYYTGKYRAENSYSGEVGLEDLTQEDIDQGYTEEDVFTDGVPALILVPIN